MNGEQKFEPTRREVDDLAKQAISDTSGAGVSKLSKKIVFGRVDNPLPAGWSARLSQELQAPYMQSLKSFLQSRIKKGVRIYPKPKEFFSAFQCTDFDSVRVVILGQDPYHGPDQAHGMCFSVRPGIAIPPSLQNIFKELQRDLGLEVPEHGYLLSWAQQGVLLLNATLSVEAESAGSHQNRGWETFTDQAIKLLSDEKTNLVYVLWGAQAQKKAVFVDEKRHLILRAPHPSPLSAHRGFLGCGHFSKINSHLIKHAQKPVDWKLPKLSELAEMHARFQFGTSSKTSVTV